MQKCLFWALGVVLLISPSVASDSRPVIEENQGKALLIYKIAKFTVWPSKTVPSAAPFTFSFWGDKALAEAFQSIEGMQTQGRSVQVIYHEDDGLPNACEVLVISKRQLPALIEVKDQLSKMPVLTVTTDPSVFSAGAMVLVEVVDDHLAFSVNLEAIKASGLEISGNLLRHAREVNF